MKAFDTVIHDALWIKLVQSGLSCKIVTIIKAIYSNVQSCVKHSDMSFSNVFDVSIGLKQGEPLSPLLFILCVNDISENIDFNDLTESDIEQLSLNMLLFADDIALFTTNPRSLQLQIDNLFRYSTKWGLKINVNKTKVCIFEKRKQRHNHEWIIDNERLEIVDDFCYLGMRFHYTGNMSYAVKALSDQALKAYNSLLSVFTRVKLDIKTKLSLFDSMVVPIILYGSEVWGIYDNKEIDKLHIKFCKRILGVRQQTPNNAVLGELGRFPLSVISKQRSIIYWSKLMKRTSSIELRMFNEQCLLNNNGTWAGKIFTFLNTLGFTDVWYHFDTNINYSHIFKQRIRDQYLQTWNTSIQNMPKLDYFKKFKIEFKYEEYLDYISNNTHRVNLTRFRLSAHNLEIEAGRYLNIERENRFCKICNLTVVESEYHFLLCCPLYRDIRCNYIKNCSFPNLNKFNLLLSSKNKSTVRNVAKYITEALKKRQEKLDILLGN